MNCRSSTDSGDGFTGEGLESTSSVSRPNSTESVGEGAEGTGDASSASMQVSSDADSSRPNSVDNIGEGTHDDSPSSAYDIGVLASGEKQVTSVSDSDKYKYLTHEHEWVDFATYEVMKKGKKSL